MLKNYVGLASTFHDSALAVVNSCGEVVFAEATERPLQFKRTLGIAPDVIHYVGDIVAKYCEPGAAIVTAYPWRVREPEPLPTVLKRLAKGESERKKGLKSVPAPLRLELGAKRYAIVAQWQMHSMCGRTLDYELARVGWEGSVLENRRYPHHLAHAATACFTCPFDDAVCVVVDGMGERSSLGFYVYDKGRLSEIVPNGNGKGDGKGSLGFFFTRVCVACGFGVFAGEEWKVMGLAPYGRDDQELSALLRKMVKVNGLRFDGNAPEEELELKRAVHAKARKHGEPPIVAANLAHAGQKVFSEKLLELLRGVAHLRISENLVLGGGCALNSSANGQVLDNSPFKNLYVFSAPGDDGNALGAALLAYREDNPHASRPPGFQSPYLGSAMSPETLRNVRRFRGNCSVEECSGRAPEKAAEMIAAGKIVGWIQGRAEFGPRALGNRSILADARSPMIKDQINSRVKFREEFRPFAPSILHEFGPQYFEHYQESPYMERTLRFRPEVVDSVPGVVHMDGTGRLQTVKRDWNPLFYRLIVAFYELTGVPLVLNTSFNVMGKPIAHSVEDVVAVFHTTGLDAVFIEDLCMVK